ncbi:uncharacterized protein ATC70_007227 [Mucor velutinosus]|uniref:Uncharacterized protein n=1 Tax=Mucor velutinosus TaxID=708070 RepID=A0AAN7HRD6_9FUNG|nr:hypothetical protein ATC70_007227 [Mucor velutinosus]
MLTPTRLTLVSLPPTCFATDQTALSTFYVEVRHPLAESEAARRPCGSIGSYQRSIHHQCCSYHIDVVSSNTPTPPSTTSASSLPPATPNLKFTAQPSFAAVVASNAGAKRKKKPAARPPPSATKASATLARLFAPQSDIPSGYQFVYYATPVRRRLSELRRLVQGVGLNNSRVLDIQYPVQNAIEVENLRCLRSLSFVRRSVRVSVARSFLLYDRINQAQFDAILKEEMLARSSSSAAAKPPSRSSDQERLAKKQRLSYLGYLLHHDAETASLLAYAVSPTLSATKDLEMSESSDN